MSFGENPSAHPGYPPPVQDYMGYYEYDKGDGHPLVVGDQRVAVNAQKCVLFHGASSPASAPITPLKYPSLYDTREEQKQEKQRLNGIHHVVNRWLIHY